MSLQELISLPCTQKRHEALVSCLLKMNVLAAVITSYSIHYTKLYDTEEAGMRCFIGIDLGSTTTKSVVIDEERNILGRGITNSRSNS